MIHSGLLPETNREKRYRYDCCLNSDNNIFYNSDNNFESISKRLNLFFESFFIYYTLLHFYYMLSSVRLTKIRLSNKALEILSKYSIFCEVSRYSLWLCLAALSSFFSFFSFFLIELSDIPVSIIASSVVWWRTNTNARRWYLDERGFNVGETSEHSSNKDTNSGHIMLRKPEAVGTYYL